MSSQPQPARAVPLVALWAVATFVAAGAFPIYTSASTQPELERLSEAPEAWTAAVLLAFVVAAGISASRWAKPAWRPLRAVLLSGAVASGLGAGVYGGYVYWFSSATLASGLGAPAIGDRAPAFEIVDPDGRVRSLDAYAGKTLLLVFYRGHW